MKKVSFIIIATLILGLVLLSYKYNHTKRNYQNLENENDELNEKIKDLEYTIDNLQIELDDAINAKDKALDLSEMSSNLLNEYLEAASADQITFTENYSNYSPSYNQKPITNSVIASITNYLSSIYFDGGNIVNPTFGNIHLLLSMSNDTFTRTMEIYDYSYSSKDNNYVSGKTDNCCYTINKSFNSISMIFTKGISTDIPTILKSNNISPNFEKGFQKYSYTLLNKSYVLRFQSSNNSLIIMVDEY